MRLLLDLWQGTLDTNSPRSDHLAAATEYIDKTVALCLLLTTINCVHENQYLW